jgi:NAD-dependent dihydropyrimidine dehydrogenase PreA subunit
MALTQKQVHVVVYEGAGAIPFSDDERFATVSALLERGYPTSRSTAPSQSAGTASLLVVARFTNGERPAIPDSAARCESVEGFTPAQVVELADAAREEFQAAQQTGWKPWFPVIDYDRCTNCMQCLSFCLFGVYGVDGEKRIQVQNQDNCKTNCPACSRVCPEAAIMFPKYKAGPINGDIVSQADLQREKMKIDISALLGGDVYQMLRARSEKAKSRFSKERDSDKALAERQKCLVKLAQMGDIPPEVLMSLPSPEEIARRAEEAAAKAQAALS